MDKNSKKTVCVLSVSKKNLSSILGTIPETLSRTLGGLKKKGYIEIKGKEIIIKNIKGLEAVL
jgi:CRP/FNR family transcriptional regulator